MILRARVVLPISRPPIEDGAVRISGNRIAQVGPWKDFSPTDGVVDLGDVILMPGLINSHCHLDYTDMTGLMPPQKSFTDWIRLMLATKSGWNYSEFAHSWVRGAHMLAKTGTTTVVDFEAVPELLPDAWSATPLRVISMFEMTGVKSRRDPRDILLDNVNHIAKLPGGRCRPGLAPHAPYSTAKGIGRYRFTFQSPCRNLKCSRKAAASCLIGCDAMIAT
jgi:aminodeoxyfutalosine deaminase